jgi:broad specificity phosphatase PhoE/orotate phosphoribosyltransferase
MITRLILVRHAEAEGNYKRLFQGWTDGELTEKGHLQAKLVAERLRDIHVDILYSSSLKRTLQTAGYISEIKGLPIIRTDKLKEINGGDWEDQPWETLNQRWPEEYETWEKKPHLHRMPNGESMEEFQKRLVEEIEYIVGINAGKSILIITHGTAIRALMCYFRGYDLIEMFNIKWCDNTAVTILDYEHNCFKVLLEGDSSHLSDDLSTIKNQTWWNDYLNNISENKIEMNLVNNLFATKAVRICPEDRPFWYTSGTIGPYYINTHFLYGNEEKANELLGLIDSSKSDKMRCPEILLGYILENYQTDMIFKSLIDEMIDLIKNNIELQNISYISGGERRDWFFSLIIAHLLDKPHITIYKDMTAVVTENAVTSELKDLNGCNVLHIADLVTEASSYERAWLPSIKNYGGRITSTVVVVDRKQGAGELLERNGVALYSMVSIDKDFFNKVFQLGLISLGQYTMLLKYTDNPKESMRDFLTSHPEFIENSLNGDAKTRERSQLCLDKGFYK